MTVIKINGKDYKINASYKIYKQFTESLINDKSEIKEIKDKSTKEILADIVKDMDTNVDLIWSSLKRNIFGLKPFVFKSRFINHISPLEINKAGQILGDALRISDKPVAESEGKESKNVK